MTFNQLWSLVLYASAAGIPLAWSDTLSAQQVPPTEAVPTPRESNSSEVNGDITGLERLTSGPLHEAFAEPVLTDPSEGLVISKAPPEPIAEEPPEYRPAGENIVWISGYWAWDEEREDFIWISGVYRNVPPGQRWVPGYWHEMEGGYQWVPGFWLDARVNELSYQPVPPENLDNGPSSPAPGANYFYVPGYWQYINHNYRWHAGYWHPCYDDWMWVPSRNCWTPRGYVFVNGYWDRRLSRRGCVFAPIYFDQPLYRNAGFRYRPSLVININTVFANLFVRPNYSHYFFGDYYGPRYRQANIYPAYAWHSQRRGYDPVISFYASFYGQQGRDFLDWSRNWHNQMVRDESARPPRTWNQAQTWQRERRDLVADVTSPRGFVAQTIDDVAQLSGADTQFVKFNDSQREALQQRAEALRDLRSQRSELESGRHVVGRVDPAPGQERERRPDAPGRFRLPPVVETATDGPDRPDDRGPRVETPRPETPRPETPRPETPRPETPRPETPRPETPRPETPRPEIPRPEIPRPEIPRPEIPRPETPRPETPRPPRPEKPREERPRGEAPRVEIPRPERPQVEVPLKLTPRAERPNVVAPRPERVRPEERIPNTRPGVRVPAARSEIRERPPTDRSPSRPEVRARPQRNQSQGRPQGKPDRGERKGGPT